MRIGVISDTHGSLTAWKEAYNKYFTDTDFIIHCGDILYHGPRNPLPEGYDPPGLAQELNSLQKMIIFVRGNCDAEVDQLMIDSPIEAPYAHVVTPCFTILTHHGHTLLPDSLPQKIKSDYNIFISGHTHLAGIKKTENIYLLNPGSPALPKNESHTPTVAMISEQKITIFNLQTATIFAEMELK